MIIPLTASNKRLKPLLIWLTMSSFLPKLLTLSSHPEKVDESQVSYFFSKLFLSLKSNQNKEHELLVMFEFGAPNQTYSPHQSCTCTQVGKRQTHAATNTASTNNKYSRAISTTARLLNPPTANLLMPSTFTPVVHTGSPRRSARRLIHVIPVSV